MSTMKTKTTAKKATAEKHGSKCRPAKPSKAGATPSCGATFGKHEKDVLTVLAAALNQEYVTPIRFQNLLERLTVFEMAYISRIARQLRERHLRGADAVIDQDLADECNRE